LNLTIFLTAGGWVGSLVEGVRRERQAVRSLFSAGRTFSATAQVHDLLVLLADMIAAAIGEGRVRIEDPSGALVAQRPELGDPAWPAPHEPLLRQKALDVGGQIYGRV